MNPDENLPEAIRTLDDAVHDLAGAQSKTLDNGQTVFRPCLYVQLVQAIHEAQKRGGGKQGDPVWLTGIQLQTKIDIHARVWAGERGHTLSLLDGLPRRKWRPQDAPTLLKWAGLISAWAVDIEEKLDGLSRMEVKAQCPNCRARYFYGTNSEGEEARSPALLVDAVHGCRCQVCHETWPPNQLEFLAMVLETDHAKGA